MRSRSKGLQYGWLLSLVIRQYYKYLEKILHCISLISEVSKKAWSLQRILKQKQEELIPAEVFLLSCLNKFFRANRCITHGPTNSPGALLSFAIALNLFGLFVWTFVCLLFLNIDKLCYVHFLTVTIIIALCTYCIVYFKYAYTIKIRMYVHGNLLSWGTKWRMYVPTPFSFKPRREQ